jgi:signal transduction histidine kinase
MRGCLTSCASAPDELGRSVGELRALGEVSQAVNSTLDFETVLSTIVTKAAQLSGTEAGAIYVFDDPQREFRLHATYGMDQELIDALTHRHIDMSDPTIAALLTQDESTQVPDLKAEAASELNEITLRAGFRARLVAPLTRGDDIVGMLVVRRRAPGAFAQNIVDLMKTFAAQSVLAIQNARLFREIEDKGRQLEVASRHKSQFLANMSHELRTPLNAILGYTELILDNIYGEAPEKMRSVLERVQTNGKHLLGLINDVLDLSKIEAGQLTLSLSDYSLAELVQGVYVAVEPLALSDPGGGGRRVRRRRGRGGAAGPDPHGHPAAADRRLRGDPAHQGQSADLMRQRRLGDLARHASVASPVSERTAEAVGRVAVAKPAQDGK